MSKKMETGIRSEVVKGYSAEQIHSLIQQKDAMAKMSPEETYRRLMYLLMEYDVYMNEFGFGSSDTSQWLDFVEELGRLREQLNDGFFAYSMYERIGGSEAKRLLDLIYGRKVLFGIIAYFMVDYIVNNEDNRKKYTIDVMNRLSKWTEIWDNSKEHNTNTVYVPVDSDISYGMRNFYGKAKAIYKYDEFVKFLIDEFDIKDGKESNHEFVQAWASLYVFLWNIYKTNPSKLEKLLPKGNAIKLEAKREESKTTITCSEEQSVDVKVDVQEKVSSTPEKDSMQVESTPEKEFVKSESTPNLKSDKIDGDGVSESSNGSILSFLDRVIKYLDEMKQAVSESSREVSLAEERLADANSKLEMAKAELVRAKKALEDATLEQQECVEKLKEAKANEKKAHEEYEEFQKLISVKLE